MDFSFLNPTSSIQMQIMSQMMESVQNVDENTDFKDMLDMMIPMMTMQMMSSSSSMFSSSGSQSSNMLGMDTSMMMMPIMMTLMEKMMADSVNSTLDNGVIDSLEKASEIQINQFQAELDGGGDGSNANCGPASFVMAIHGLGLQLPGEFQIGNDGNLLDLARDIMVTDAARDGKTSEGYRSETENSLWTNFTDLKNGADTLGIINQRINPDADDILDAINENAMVIVSGTFAGKVPLPWTGDRANDSNTAPGNATHHFVVVSGYNQDTNQFMINDPARNTPLAVSASQLENFMTGNEGAIAFYSAS